DPAAVLDTLEPVRAGGKIVVVGETEEDVARALDAGADMAFERTRLPSGVLSHHLDVAIDEDAFTTMELPIPRSSWSSSARDRAQRARTRRGLASASSTERANRTRIGYSLGGTRIIGMAVARSTRRSLPSNEEVIVKRAPPGPL